MYILKDYPTHGKKRKRKISDKQYEQLTSQAKGLYRQYTVEDEDIENGHYFPGHETWEDSRPSH